MNKILLSLALLTAFSCGQSTPNKDNIDNKKDAATTKEATTITKELIAHSEWRLENKVAQKLGQSCTNEELLTFKKDKVQHSICKNGELITIEEPWSLKRAEDGQWKLTIADKHYSLIISGNTFILNNVSGQKDQDSSGRKFIGETSE